MGSKAFLLVCLSLAILSIITSSQGAKLLPEVANDAMNGNNKIEAQRLVHLLKWLGKIFKAGKLIIDCNKCKDCTGICRHYCCR